METEAFLSADQIKRRSEACLSVDPESEATIGDASSSSSKNKRKKKSAALLFVFAVLLGIVGFVFVPTVDTHVFEEAKNGTGKTTDDDFIAETKDGITKTKISDDTGVNNNSPWAGVLPENLSCKNFDEEEEKKHDPEKQEFVRNLNYDDVERFVLFFGFARSGSSWIGSVLDASPNALIANELGALDLYANRHWTRKDLFHKLASNSFLCGKYGRIQAYDYSIPGLWQGKLRGGDKLRVIGDKQAGQTSKLMREKFGRRPWENEADAASQRRAFERFFAAVKAKPRIVLVLRNPFDKISTTVMRKAQAKNTSSEDAIHGYIDEASKEALALYKENMWASKNLGTPDQWHVMTMENFAANTEEELERLCEFVGIECPPTMVAEVVNRTHHEVHHTFDMVNWNENQTRLMNEYIRSELSEYYEAR